MDHIVRILIGNCIIQNSAGFLITHFYYLIIKTNNSDYLQKARKYGHFTGYKN